MSVVAFVAGATGYTGREVVRLLAEQGARVVAHVRPESARRAEWTERFQAQGAEVDCTPWDEEAMSETLRELQPTQVYALLGTTAKRAKREGLDDPYERVDYGLSALLIRATVASGARPRLVYLSAAGLSETTRNPYMRARVKVEADLRASGLPWTSARPSFITGPDRDESRPGERFGAAVGDALLGLAGAFGARRLRERYRSTTPQALARALVRLASDPAMENKVAAGAALRPDESSA